MQIKVSSAVAYGFNQLIYTICALAHRFSAQWKKPSLSIPGAEIANIDDGDVWWCLLSQIFLRFFFLQSDATYRRPVTGDPWGKVDNKRCYISECRYFLGHPALSLTIRSIKGVCPICETVELSPYLLSKRSVEGVGKGSECSNQHGDQLLKPSGTVGHTRGIGHLGLNLVHGWIWTGERLSRVQSLNFKCSQTISHCPFYTICGFRDNWWKEAE